MRSHPLPGFSLSTIQFGNGIKVLPPSRKAVPHMAIRVIELMELLEDPDIRSILRLCGKPTGSAEGCCGRGR